MPSFHLIFIKRGDDVLPAHFVLVANPAVTVGEYHVLPRGRLVLGFAHKLVRSSELQAEVTCEWVTYRQAAEIAGRSRTTLRKLGDEVAIKVRRVGRAVRINRASLDAYMNGDDDAGQDE